MDDSPNRDSGRFQRSAVLLLAVGITILFLFVVKDFLMPLLLAGIFAGLLQPVYRKLRIALKGRKVLASVVTIMLALLLIGLPLVALTSVVVGQAYRVSDSAFSWLQFQMEHTSIEESSLWLSSHFPEIEAFLPEQEKIVEILGQGASKVATVIMSSLTSMTTGVASFMLNCFVMLYAMFFFLIDGPSIVRKMMHYLPLNREHRDAMLGRFTQVTRATLKGSVVIGFIQGALGGVGLYAAGVEGAVFWSAIMMVLSVIPGIGTPLVWGPAVVWLLIRGDYMAGCLLLAWGAGVVASVDNVLRPILVGKDANLPDLYILIGTLGGIFMFGAVGFIIGPIICALFVTVWDIYGVVYQSELEKD
ncbi:AI-2E family transporter [Rubritalea marina]|uniref:AI-2E family transporter n=1 Tax=Rubritalea marina TaxID=361055 RepID=UPI00035DAA8F|nr:AI-2E family transporter [Rubritalea marina]